jgi:hypothetical protein
MADATEASPEPKANKPPRGSKSQRAWVRPWLRAIHRDAGYLAVGLTFIYAVSGIAVNHIADWTDGDASFKNFQATHELGPLSGDEQAVARAALAKLGVTETPKDVYRRSDDEIDVSLKNTTLHINQKTGHIDEEGKKPRFLLRVANWLHLNRGKKAWSYVADAYAAALLFLSFSGMFMLPGRKGFLGRGAILVAIGVAIPVVYVQLSGGP